MLVKTNNRNLDGGWKPFQTYQSTGNLSFPQRVWNKASMKTPNPGNNCSLLEQCCKPQTQLKSWVPYKPLFLLKKPQAVTNINKESLKGYDTKIKKLRNHLEKPKTNASLLYGNLMKTLFFLGFSSSSQLIFHSQQGFGLLGPHLLPRPR